MGAGAGGRRDNRKDRGCQGGIEDTLKAEEEGTADTSGVDGRTVSQDYKVGLMIPQPGTNPFYASFRSIEPIKEQLGVDVDYVEAGVDTSNIIRLL
ncbi:hypothetical protein [Enterocloster sp.]|uniref:hypothetical protein n=1 Tax=Enterocloster sp. TaxID=2719315 RepID=UPI0039A12FDB